MSAFKITGFETDIAADTLRKERGVKEERKRILGYDKFTGNSNLWGM